MTSVTRQILVADDDTHVRQALLVRLEAAGFEVLSASGGQEAIELFDACRPAAVILDANMPAISGLAVCEHIKEDTTGEKVPVIFISGASSTSSDYVERCSGRIRRRLFFTKTV